jgi:hypothetical protein
MIRRAALICIVPLIVGSAVVRAQEAPTPGVNAGTVLAQRTAPLLPSQEKPNFFNVRICRDREVLAALKTAATNMLRTKVIVAMGDGPKWSGYQPDDIHMEAVSLSADEKNGVFCSVTISAKGITERILYVVGTTSDSWLVRFGGDLGPGGGGHKLFPKGPITVKPTAAPVTSTPSKPAPGEPRSNLQIPIMPGTRGGPAVGRFPGGDGG